MKAIKLQEPRQVDCVELEKPVPGPGQALVRIKTAGICGSDIGAFRGTNKLVSYPRIIGHELAGILEEVPADNPKGLKPGDKVIVDPYLYCGKCYPCSIGRTNCCTDLKVLGVHVEGGMAEYMTHPADMLWKLPDDMPWDIAPMAEPLTIALHGIHRGELAAGEHVAIIGAGPIGLLTGIVLKHAGASKIIISDVDDARLAMCKEFGFETVNVKNESMIDYVNQATGNVGVDVVFECSGSEPSALEITKLCRIGGMICLTGVHKVPHAVNLQDVNFKEQTLVGSRVYTLREFGQAVEYAKEIAPELEKIVTHVVPLAESEKVFDLIKDPGEMTVKVLVDCR